jgi:hypothetical protein
MNRKIQISKRKKNQSYQQRLPFSALESIIYLFLFSVGGVRAGNSKFPLQNVKGRKKNMFT